VLISQINATTARRRPGLGQGIQTEQACVRKASALTPAQADPLARATLAEATAAREVNPATFSCNANDLALGGQAGQGKFGVGRRELPK